MNTITSKYEYKYLIPNECLNVLRDMISPFVEADSYMKYGGSEGYTVRSIYYDTRQFEFYHDKLEGLKIRKKLRIRGYNEHNGNDIIFLEIKRKNEKAISKDRAPVKYENLHHLFTGDIEPYILTDNGIKNAVENSQRFFFHIRRKSLKPIVLVIYEREAFMGKFDRSLRITFDKNLRSTINPDIHMLYNDENIKYSLPHNFVLEVKFHGIFPSWLSAIISSFSFKRQSYSKYTKCIDEHLLFKKNPGGSKLDSIKAIHL